MMEQATWQGSESSVTEGTQAGNLCFGDAMNGIPILNGRLDWETTKVFFKLYHSQYISIKYIFFNMEKKNLCMLKNREQGGSKEREIGTAREREIIHHLVVTLPLQFFPFHKRLLSDLQYP